MAMDVRLPDGRIVRNVPDHITKSELAAKLHANNVIDAETAAQWAPADTPLVGANTQPMAAGMTGPTGAQATKPETPRQKLDASIGLGEKILINLGRGFTDVGEGFAQTGLALNALLGITDDAQQRLRDYTRAADAERALFEAGNVDEGVAGVVPRFAGNVAGMAIPGGFVAKGVTKLAPAASSAMMRNMAGRATMAGAAGAAEGATTYVGEDESRFINTVLGAGAGAIFGEAAFRIARRLYGKSGPDAAQIVLDELPASMDSAARDQIALEVATGVPLTKAMERAGFGAASAEGAEKALNIADGLTPEQAARKLEIEQIPGVKATLGRVNQDLDQLHFEHEQLRHSGPLADLEQKNRQAVFDEAGRMVENYTRASDPFDSGESVRRTIEAGKKAARQKTGAAYRAADAEAAAELQDIQPTRIVEFLKDSLDSFSAEEMAPLVSTLKRNNLIYTDKDGLFQIVENANLTPTAINTIRKQLNKVKTKDRASKRLIREGKDALDQDVVSAIGRDIYKDARSIAKAEFDLFDNRQKVQAILEGVIQPDDVVRYARSKSFRVKDINEMLDTLTKIDNQAADDLRGGILRSLVSDLTGRADRGGVPEINFQTFRRNLDGMGRAKLDAIFGREGARAINDFASAVGALTRVDKGVANPGTAGTLAKMLKSTIGIAGKISAVIPGGSGVVDFLAGAHRVVKSANLDAKEKERALRAINVELLQREQLAKRIADALKKRDDDLADMVGPGVPIIAGAGGSEASQSTPMGISSL